MRTNLTFLILFFWKILQIVSQDIPLNEYAIIMSHDAATGYLVRDHIVAKWAITQQGTLYDQLNCGSRSFDYRPYYFNGTVYAHHGGVKINVPLQEAVTDVTNWCTSHPSELVILYVNSCEGDEGCLDATLATLQQLHIPIITDCTDLNGLTVNQASEYGRLSTGGHLIALFECVEEEYDSTINCYGKDFVCYDSWPSNTSDIPWNNMITYINQVTSSIPVADGRLWMTQAHWQSTAVSIVDGTLHNSSLLLDEERSNVNSWMAENIRNKTYQFLNIVEVDNVCDNGLSLLDAINEFNAGYEKK